MSKTVLSRRNKSIAETMCVNAAPAVPVPTFFQCPISLELMSDPVTLSTGHTYDRNSIERWFHAGKNTCPRTRQEVKTTDLLPNITLKNCIRSWQMSTDQSTIAAPTCRSKESKLPTSPRRLSAKDVTLMLDDIRLGSQTLENLKSLRNLAKSSDRNRNLITEGGAIPMLGSIFSRGCNLTPDSTSCPSPTSREDEVSESSLLLSEEALGALVDLSANAESDIKHHNLPHVGRLSWFLRNGSSDAKIHSVRIVECLIEDLDDDCLLQLGATEGLIQGLVGLLHGHQALMKAGKPSLRSLYAICLPKKNRSVAAEAGAVAEVLELLPGATRDIAEGALAILDLMSRCKEGRTELNRHALCVPIMVKSIVAYSSSATEHVVKVLHSLLVNNTIDQFVYGEAIKTGLIAKLLMINQTHHTSSDTHHKVRELLKNLHAHCGIDPCVRTITYSR